MELLGRGIDFGLERNDLDAGGDFDYLKDESELDENSTNGNKFQNENVYNRLLPYNVTEESQEHLMRIKASLSKAILLNQETLYEWFIELERFVDLYGLAFSKEDHIYFVKLQFELMISKDSLDLYNIAYVARCFSRLMRKRYLIGSEELVLDWRPLYEQYERLLFSETENLGLLFVPDNLESNLSQAIRLARPHFPIQATQEMLDEWRPMLCPFSSVVQRAITYLNLFLPTTLPPEHHDSGFRLWFDEIMELWLNSKVCAAAYESKLTLLLSRLSSDCTGSINWEPYIPKIFNHFKRGLDLNGSITGNQVRRYNESIDVGPCVQWMVYMISTDNSCLDHISKLFKAIESFYHPSNSDRRWHTRLQQFLYKLPACFVKRVYRERYKNDLWSKRIPQSYKLTEEQITKFVDSLMPVVLTSMFNQAGISSAALAFKDLSVLRPEKVIPPLLDRLYGSYETLTEPHRLLATIYCMASVVPAMVRPCKYFSQGPNHVVPLLLNSIPGVDTNDMRKCIAVFRFVATLTSHISLKDYSFLVDERTDLTLEQQQLCLSTGQFEDFVIQFLDKCFILIENTANTVFLNSDSETHLKNGEEGIIEAAISSVTLTILVQSSKEIQIAALDRVYSHVTRHIFDTKTQGKAIATLCLACARSCPKETLAKFVPHFSRLVITLTSNEEVFQDSILDNELLFSLLLMSEIVRCNSPHLLDHKDSILDVIERALKLRSKEGYMFGCNILRHLLRALTGITCCDWRNINFNDEKNKAIEKNWPFDNWGQTMHVKNLSINWGVPSEESRFFAQKLIENFLRKAVEDLVKWSQDQMKLTREEVHRSLHIILGCLVGAAPVLPTLESKVINLCPFELPVESFSVGNTGTPQLNFSDGTNVRTWVVESMKQVLNYIKTTNEDDAKSLTLICEIFSTAIAYFGFNKAELRLAAQRIKSMKSTTQNKLLGSKRYLRHLLVERVAQQHGAMLLNKGGSKMTELHLDVLKILFELAHSHYVEVRILSQDTLYMILNQFPFAESILVPMLVEEFRKPEIEHNKFKGLLHLVVGRRSYSSIAVDPNWIFLQKLWPALIESPHSEKPSIVKLLDRICGLVQKTFDTFELRYEYSSKLKDIAAEVWTTNLIDRNKYSPPDSKYISEVKSKVDLRNDQREDNYKRLVLKLVELIENPHLHWHRKLVAYNLFTHLMRVDHPLPLSALHVCLSSLTNERLAVRVKALQLLSAQLKLHKRKHKKRTIKFLELDNDRNRSENSSKQSGLSESSVNMNDDIITGNSNTDQSLNEISSSLELPSNSNKWMQYKLIDRDYTKDEWENMIFVDRPYLGFYTFPKKLEIYEPYEKQPKLNRSPSEFNEYELAIYKKFMDSTFVKDLVKYFCFEDSKGSSDFHIFSAKRPNLFKGLFRNYGPCMIEPFRKYVLEYATNTCEQKQRFVIEFLAGVLRGSKHWSYEMMIELKEFVLPLLNQMTISQENLNDWSGLTNYVFRNRDAKRLIWLLNYFITKATSATESKLPSTTPFIQTSRLALAQHAVIQLEWRAVDHIFPQIVENLRGQDHLFAYANVRTILASLYALIYMFDDPTTLTKIPDTLTCGPKRTEFIDYLLAKLASLEKIKKSLLDSTETDISQADSSICDSTMDETNSNQYVGTTVATSPLSTTVPMDAESSSESDMDLIAETLMKFRRLETNPESPAFVAKNLSPIIKTKTADGRGAIVDNRSFVENLRGAMPSLSVVSNMSNNSEELTLSQGDSKEKKDTIKLIRMISIWLVYVISMLRSPIPSDVFKLLPAICEMGRDNSDPELKTDSLAAVAMLGGCVLSVDAMDEAFKCVRRIIANNSWHARFSAAVFIEIMVSSNLFRLFNNDKWRTEIEDILINHLICDDRIEVRESSSLTLSGLIHCEVTKLTPKLLNEFKRRADEPLIKRKQSNGTITIDSKSTVIRHSGILCLCACVEAYPYTVPDHLPEILTLLSDHLTDPQPISTTIKKTMSNFKRTHHDNWHNDKNKFTDDQLCILADLLVSPSYYA